MYIPLPQVATIGDMPTDMLMFDLAGSSVAMGNASPGMQCARQVTISNEEEGFANVVEAYPGSVRYVCAVKRAGMRTAVVSSSENCQEVLIAAGIAELFDARIDGVVAAEQHLAGKPAPDTYLAAARALAATPAQAAVFEDALAGVAAGRAGSFGGVVGVDRAGQADELRFHGADVVVSELTALLEAR